jgi:Tol biopolymer transport system component
MPLEAALIAALLPPAFGAAIAPRIERISLHSGGLEANGASRAPAFSADGRYVAFESVADNLVPGDTFGYSDVFVRELASGLTTRVSVGSNGQQAFGGNWRPAISSDGRFVAFESNAANIIGTYAPFVQILVHDRLTGITECVSVSGGGEFGNRDSFRPSISADGRLVSFDSNATNLASSNANQHGDVYVRDRAAGTTVRVSVSSSGEEGDNSSWGPCLSADGRFVAFSSVATNLVAGDTNGEPDVFIRELSAGITTRVSQTAQGAPSTGRSYGPSLSATGRYVAFESTADDLVPGDNNGFGDVIVADLSTGRLRLASVSSAGIQGNLWSFTAGLSADGRYVSFLSRASNLVRNDANLLTDAFVHDALTGRTRRLNRAWNGAEANADCETPALSADGRALVFVSRADNLVPGDTNAVEDVFLVR